MENPTLAAIKYLKYAYLFLLFVNVQVLSTKCGTTTTLRRHSARFHPEEWAKIQNDGKLVQKQPIKKNTVSPKSLIYQIFDKRNEKAICKICSKVFKASDNRGYETFLLRHAVKAHTEEWNEILEIGKVHFF